jgi:fucose 4-O-acetylase-like acetyltransferase
MREITRGDVDATRIAWIDVARGIGILLVVLGHLETGLLYRVIYVFHMPFFFFLSGYVHKIQNRYADFFRKRSIHLLVPYASFLLLLAPLELHRASHGGKGAIFRAITDMIWGGDRLRGDLGVFWFITCLFATQQVANWILSKFRLGQVAVCGVISISLAYANSLFVPRFMLPLDLNVVLGALPFYLAGHYARRANFDRWWITLFAIIGIVATVWLAYVGLPISYDMRSANYGVPLLSLLLAGCSILALIRAIKLILLATPVATILEKIGAASLGIMFIHKPLPGLPGFSRLSILYPFAAFVLVSLVAYLCTILLSRFSFGRAIFLGSQIDFLALISRNRELESSKGRADN